MNNYRVDLVKKQDAGSDYIVPCGMNTIVHLTGTMPNMTKLVKQLPEHKEGMVYIYSKWDNVTNDYKLISIIEKKGN